MDKACRLHSTGLLVAHSTAICCTSCANAPRCPGSSFSCTLTLSDQATRATTPWNTQQSFYCLTGPVSGLTDSLQWREKVGPVSNQVGQRIKVEARGAVDHPANHVWPAPRRLGARALQHLESAYCACSSTLTRRAVVPTCNPSSNAMLSMFRRDLEPSGWLSDSL